MFHIHNGTMDTYMDIISLSLYIYNMDIYGQYGSIMFHIHNGTMDI